MKLNYKGIITFVLLTIVISLLFKMLNLNDNIITVLMFLFGFFIGPRLILNKEEKNEDN